MSGADRRIFDLLNIKKVGFEINELSHHRLRTTCTLPKKPFLAQHCIPGHSRPSVKISVSSIRPFRLKSTKCGARSTTTQRCGLCNREYHLQSESIKKKSGTPTNVVKPHTDTLSSAPGRR